MARFRNTLDHVRIAAPCNADWDQMLGDERVRFCGQCTLNVYNLSGMTRSDAESLITSTEGRLCVRFYRRRDGSIITKDCPIGLRAIRRKMSYVARAATSMVLGLFAGLGVHETFSRIVPFLPERKLMGAIALPADRYGHTTDPPVVKGEMIRIGETPSTRDPRHPSSRQSRNHSNR